MCKNLASGGSHFPSSVFLVKEAKKKNNGEWMMTEEGTAAAIDEDGCHRSAVQTHKKGKTLIMSSRDLGVVLSRRNQFIT